LTTADACYAAGIEALERGNLEEAEAWAVRCDASGGESNARCATLHGMIAARRNDFAGAHVQFRRALEYEPGNITVAPLLADALMAVGETGEAEAVLARAVERSPDDAELLVNLGYARAAQGNGQGARDALERAVLIDPEPSVLQALARIYEALEQWPLAAAALDRAARDAPTPALLGELAALYLRLEQYTEAERVFRTLREHDPEHEVLAYHGQIWCRIKRHDWRGALDVALTTTRLDPYSLTTALLAYAKDRLLASISPAEALARERELGERFSSELREHADAHGDDDDLAILEEVAERGGAASGAGD
jgi:tetratricopeptide (TPR) repeat protein